MISYEPLKKTLKERGLSVRELDRRMGNSGTSLIKSLSQSKYILTSTIDKLCNILICNISDIISWQNGIQEIKNQTPRLLFDVNWEIIQESVEKLNLTLTSLSKKAGLSLNTLTSSKKNLRPLKKNTIDSIAAVLDCSAESLILHEESAE